VINKSTGKVIITQNIIERKNQSIGFLLRLIIRGNDKMNISIRGYIKDNFKNTNEKELQDSIESSIKEGAEEALPGLGVFFEVLWQNSSSDGQKEIIENLAKGFN